MIDPFSHLGFPLFVRRHVSAFLGGRCAQHIGKRFPAEWE